MQNLGYLGLKNEEVMNISVGHFKWEGGEGEIGLKGFKRRIGLFKR